MADRKRRTRRTRREVKTEEPEVEETEDVEDEEVVKSKPARGRRPRRVIIKEPEEDEGDEDEEVEDVIVEEVGDEEEPDEESEIMWDEDNQPVLDEDESFTMGVVTEENPVLAALQSMHQGQLLTVMRVADNSWVLSTAQAKNNKPLARAGGKLTGKEYEQEVQTPEFLAWLDEWHKLTGDEKVAKAKKAGCKWEENDNDSINVMRAGMAMREHLGLEKYKPEYATRAARNRVKGK